MMFGECSEFLDYTHRRRASFFMEGLSDVLCGVEFGAVTEMGIVKEECGVFHSFFGVSRL